MFRTSTEIKANHSCAKSARNLLRSGAPKANGTSVISAGKTTNINPAMTNTQHNITDADGKVQNKKTTNGTAGGKNSKKRRRRKHKGNRRDRNKEGKNKGKQEKHQRRRTGNNYF